MTTVTHEVVFNVESGQYSVNPALDIPQGDYNSHIIYIKLRNNDNEFISITDTCKVLISFTDANGKLIVSDAVTIVNAYRGELSYIIGKSIVKDTGRYVVVVNLSNSICTNCYCCNDNMSLRLVVNVNLNGSSVSNSLDYEVSISKSFYDELNAHLKDELIHLDEDDREFLNRFKGRSDELEALLDGVAPTPPDPPCPDDPNCPCKPVHKCPYNLRLIDHEVPSDDQTYIDISFPQVFPKGTKVGDYLLGTNGYVARIINISYELGEISNLNIKGLGHQIFEDKSIKVNTTNVVEDITFSKTSFEVDDEVLTITTSEGSYQTTPVISSVTEVDNSQYPVSDTSDDDK